MIISDGLTWPAIVAEAKTCTRRLWKQETSRRLRRHDIFKSYHNAPFVGGVHIATCRVIEPPFAEEQLSTMPDTDYEGEGFRWMHDHPWSIPKKAKRFRWAWGNCSFDSFQGWRRDYATDRFYVVRYVIEDVTAAGYRLLAELKEKSDA